MRAYTGDAKLVSRFSGLSGFEKEVDATLRPVHISITVLESPLPAYLLLKVVKQTVEPIEVVLP